MPTKVSYPSFGYPHQDSSTRKQLKNTRIGETGSRKIGEVGGLMAERKASLVEIEGGGGQEDKGGKWCNILTDGFVTQGAVSTMLIPTTSGEYVRIALTLYLILQS